MTAREIRSPFVIFRPGERDENDYGAYPVPSDTPEPEVIPKDAAAVAADLTDLIPTDQGQLAPPAEQ